MTSCLDWNNHNERKSSIAQHEEIVQTCTLVRLLVPIARHTLQSIKGLQYWNTVQLMNVNGIQRVETPCVQLLGQLKQKLLYQH